MDNARNIEIKSRIKDNESYEKCIEIARRISGSSEPIEIYQHDIFFNSTKGRLKLRCLPKPAKSQLIYYERSDITGPKLSTFDIVETDNPDILKKILEQSMGIKGVVIKKRLLFLLNETRIHIDKVEKLGDFLEFEVCLRPTQTIEEGESIAKDLMNTFSIQESDLIMGSYFDELNI